MKIKEKSWTGNFSVGVNTCEYVIIHHTASKEGSLKGIKNMFTERGGKVSCHFIVDVNGDIYQIGEENQILWHAGISSWKGRSKSRSMNAFSIGIEVIGPLSNGNFTDKQRESVKEIVAYLCEKYKIPEENVLRHADIAWTRSNEGKLWDGKGRARKVDIADTFWNNKFKTFGEYRKSLFDKKQDMKKEKTDFLKILQKERSENPDYTPLFSSYSGNELLTEGEVRQIIEIASIRFYKLYIRK